MSPASPTPRQRDEEPEPLPEPETVSERTRDDIFNLVPTRPLEDGESESPDEAPPGAAAAAGRNVHTIGISDLSRLSIDNDGRLYWDGKPVEVQRRILMSRRQILAASLIGAFVMIGALGAAVHASAAALDWACRMGWTTQYCPPPPDLGPPPPPDIPA
jgi:hypothetical protein